MPATPNEFVTYCCDLLVGIGPSTSKRMFGGWGIWSDGLFFALVADMGSGDKLWLKVNEETRSQFEKAGCQRFTYEAKGESKGMNYYTAPEDAMESPALMLPWARLAFQAALSAANAKKPSAKAKAVTAKRATKDVARRATKNTTKAP